MTCFGVSVGAACGYQLVLMGGAVCNSGSGVVASASVDVVRGCQLNVLAHGAGYNSGG